MPHYKDLLPTICLRNHQLSEQWQQGNLTRPVALFELDINATFPSLDRTDAWTSISTIAELVA